VADYHFVGAARVAASPDGSKLREIASLSESRALWQRALERVTQVPGRLSEGRLAASAVQAAAPWLRPLLIDLWERESALRVQRQDGSSWDWTLAVELGPERMGVWRTNLVALAQAWELGPVLRGTAGDLPTMEIVGTNGVPRMRWVEAGSWGLLGIGPANLPGLVDALGQVRVAQRPVTSLTNAWLNVSADLAQLTGPLNLPPGSDCPQVSISWRGDGEHVRASGRIGFEREPGVELEEWQIPTNIISEPLISFSALRGVRPFLMRSERLRQLLPDRLPNQVFTWAQGTAEAQLYCAFPATGFSEHLPGLATTLPQAFPRWVQELGLTRFVHNPDQAVVSWQGILPSVTPTLGSVRHQDQEFALGSMFPPIPLGPPPDELLAQLARENLVFYSWEVTPPRVAQWIMLSQLMSVMTKTPQLPAGQPALRWLFRVAPELGNTATEVLALSGREWSFERKSTLGFGAAELVFGMRWIEGASFPRPALLLDQPSGAPGPAAAPQP